MNHIIIDKMMIKVVMIKVPVIIETPMVTLVELAV